MPSPVGGLQLAGVASLAYGIINNNGPTQPLCWSFGEKGEKRGAGTTTQSKKNNPLATSFRRKVIETNSRQNLMFGPGGGSGRLDDCQFRESGGRFFVGGLVWNAMIVSGLECVLKEWRFKKLEVKKECGFMLV